MPLTVTPVTRCRHWFPGPDQLRDRGQVRSRAYGGAAFHLDRHLRRGALRHAGQHLRRDALVQAAPDEPRRSALPGRRAGGLRERGRHQFSLRARQIGGVPILEPSLLVAQVAAAFGPRHRWRQRRSESWATSPGGGRTAARGAARMRILIPQGCGRSGTTNCRVSRSMTLWAGSANSNRILCGPAARPTTTTVSPLVSMKCQGASSTVM